MRHQLMSNHKNSLIMKEKNYKVVNGGDTYRTITPNEAERILEAHQSDVYALYPCGLAERLQLPCDVEIFQESGIDTFGMKVGNISEMLLDMA